MSGCAACGRPLRFTERVAWPSTFCFPCASARGVVRLADAGVLGKLHGRAAGIPAWWRWTVFLGHATLWGPDRAHDPLR